MLIQGYAIVLQNTLGPKTECNANMFTLKIITFSKVKYHHDDTNLH